MPKRGYVNAVDELRNKALLMHKKRNPLKSIEYCNMYLSYYPTNIGCLILRARNYKIINCYNKSLADLLLVLELEPTNKKAKEELFHLYYYFGKYNEAYSLFDEVKDLLYQKDLDVYEIILKKKMGLLTFDDVCNMPSIKQQIFNYFSSEVIFGIKKITINSNYQKCGKNTYFCENVNARYLYDCVMENLCNHERYCVRGPYDVYLFSLPKIGFQNGDICNYIRVLVIPGTYNILNIAPINTVHGDVVYLDCDMEKLYNISFEKTKKLYR